MVGVVLAPTGRLSRMPSKHGSHDLVCVPALFDYILGKGKPGTGREVGQPIPRHSDHSKRLYTHISLDMVSGTGHPITSGYHQILELVAKKFGSVFSDFFST